MKFPGVKSRRLIPKTKVKTIPMKKGGMDITIWLSETTRLFSGLPSSLE